MTISATTLRKSFTGDGSTTAFSFDKRFLADADLKVYQEGTLKTITTHYTVTGAGNSGGGTVTFLTAPAVDDEIVIINDPANTQSLDLVGNDPFPAESLEAVLDRLTLQIQRCRDLISRSVVLSDTDLASASTALPSPTANYYLRWNSAGTALENVALATSGTLAVSAFSESLLDETSASAWRTGLGLGTLAIQNAASVAITGGTISASVKALDYLEYRDEKASGTNGGTATSGSWFTRTLNTEAFDTGGIGSLAANVITLPAGTYECDIDVPGSDVTQHQARLYNVTGTAVLLYGSTTAGTTAGGFGTSHSRITGRFTLAGATEIQVEHRVATTKADTGLGAAASFGNVEVYTVARFWKVA